MLASIVAFTNDAAGLEKTLRLFQSLCTVAIGLYGPMAVTADQAELLEPWMTARGHFMYVALHHMLHSRLAFRPGFVQRGTT